MKQIGELIMVFILSVAFVIIIILCGETQARSSNSQNIQLNFLEDADLTTDELLRKYKYPAQKYYVKTEDGYILGIYRIVRKGALPFLLVHGLLDSSDTFLIMGPNIALGYYLWDEGYDVWLGNVRGNRYSRNHTTLDPRKNQFWDFSFHEMGVHDLPAMIDYILRNTGVEKLFYVGHSQGCTSFMIMCIKRPQYQKKIILMHAMAPAIYFNHTRSMLWSFLDSTLTMPILNQSNFEIFRRGQILRPLCIMENFEDVCLDMLYRNFGRNPKEFNKTMLPVIVAHCPAGSSLKQLRHYQQFHGSKQFREYDFGRSRNFMKYGKPQPPIYNVSAITVPIFVYYGKNDIVCDYRDSERLYRDLSHGVGLYKISDPEWTHTDFVWGINARELVYKLVVNATETFIAENENKDENI